MKTYIAFDIGGTMIKYGVFNEEAELFFMKAVPTQASAGGKDIIKRVCQIIQEQKATSNLVGVGISTAGMVDYENGTILYANDNIPDYTGTKIKQIIEKRCGLPCEVENDVACAALSEQKVGAARGSKICLCITVGTGIGGAIILDGKIFHGSSNSAGNIGYMNVFGKRFESLASSRVLLEQVKREKGITDDTFDGIKLFEQAKQKDKICEESIQNMCDTLAYGIANACCILNPEIVVLGGGIMEQKEYLDGMLQGSLDKYLPQVIRRSTKLTFAQNGNRAGILGAYYNFKERSL